MNPSRLARTFLALGLFAGLTNRAHAQLPNLLITRSGQNVVLPWLAENGRAYQLQSSPDLAAWSDLNAVVIGSGSNINIQQPITTTPRFFRVTLPNGIFAIFESGNGLTTASDDFNNTITISRNAAGNILVNGGAVTIAGGTATVANTPVLRIFGNGGNDVISLNESNGALPHAELYGGPGNDTLTGGSGADLLFGGSDNDTLLGKGGSDFLFGGVDDDTLTGGDADDQVFGESGNDRMIWNPGDDTDLNEGGAGIDTVEVNGGSGAEVFTTTANGARARFDRTSPAPFTLDIGTCEALVLNMNGDTDTFTINGNSAGLSTINVNGGTGADSVTVNDVTGSSLALVNVDLAGSIGGTTGDSMADIVTVNGTAAPDIINVADNAGVVELTGLAAAVRITHSESANDNLTINGLGGTDTFNIGPGVTSLIQVTTNQ